MYEIFILISLIVIILVEKAKEIAIGLFIGTVFLYFLNELLWIETLTYKLGMFLIVILYGYCIYSDVLEKEE